MNRTKVTIKPTLFCAVLLSVASALLLASLGLQFASFRSELNVDYFLPLFDVSLEQNLPTFFSTVLLLIIGAVLVVLFVLESNRRSKFLLQWGVLATGFFYMAYDEGFHAHENLVALIRPMLWHGRLGPFYYAWVIPAIIVVALLYLFFLKFLRSLDKTMRRLFETSALIYLSGAIGMEMVGGYYDEADGSNNLVYNILSTIEEGCEMGGLIMFIWCLLYYATVTYGEIRLDFRH
jgi:hypothetical protein